MAPKPQAPKKQGQSKARFRPTVSKDQLPDKVPPLRDGDTSFLPDQGPKINGSSLQYTSSTNKSFKIPEPRL